ncbi:hypothetical protein DYB28_007090 [Aphanomyces astaci]|uniref:C2 domain-containing protein n=1 Tax=Aphanomyces astaci TaxID=112090 RepID=A0A9X8HFF1_APHAT|nr:hypothetical protein DYB28_007090 [Aphanomyces astaci]
MMHLSPEHHHPTKLVLTLLSAALLPGPAMRNVHAVVTGSDKTFKCDPCHRKTTKPTWEDATFAFDVRDKTHLHVRVQLVGVKNLLKHKIGHFDLYLTEHRLATEGAHSLACPLVGGAGGIVNVTMSLFREPQHTRDWARRQVAASSRRRRCHSLLQCVPTWSTREELFKNACGRCFLALVETHSMCDDSFTAKELLSHDASSSSTTASHDSSHEDHHNHHDSIQEMTLMNMLPPRASPNNTDDTTAPTIQEWMQARHPNGVFPCHPNDHHLDQVKLFPLLLQLMWLLPLSAIVLQLCIAHISR